MNDTEKDAKIPEGLCIKEEHDDPSEKWLDIKEESAQADDECEYKFSPLMLLPPKQESGDGAIPHSLSKTSVSKVTNFKIYLDGQIMREEVEYNASCDNTAEMHQATSLLPSTDQVHMEDSPNSEEERTSTCKKLGTGVSGEEASCSDDNQKNLKLEDEDHLSNDPLEIREQIPSDDTDSDDTCDDQSPSLWPLHEGTGNPVEHELTEPKENPFTCDICSEPFITLLGLAKHKQKHKEKSLTCDVCDKSFHSKGKLMEHMQVHTNEKPFTCNVCDFASSYKRSLWRHKRIHANERQFTCDVCNKAFNDNTYLTEHMQIHTREMPYTCDVCNKGFRRKLNFVEHMRIHTGELFPCDICNKGFTRKSSLVKHMRKHTEKKVFTCDVCNQDFSRKSKLAEHMQIHTGKKRFTCDVCKKDFSKKSVLDQHVRIHSGEKPFTCDVCNRAYVYKHALVQHMRIHEKP